MPTVLAHQGGWDEVLIFAVPVVVYLAVRWWERRRGDGPDAPGEGDPPS